jgi:hypothetical protein
MLIVMAIAGRSLSGFLGLADDPFMAMVLGFVLLAYLLLGSALLVPGLDWPVAIGLGCVALIGPRAALSPRTSVVASLGLAVALFTFSWCADTAPRLAHFYATGELLFWNDFYFHAATLAHFAAPDAIGRGMPLMADFPAPVYHYASYLPSAMVARLAGVPLLDTALLIWLPLGIVIMACGVVSLGLSLGGPWLAIGGLSALAFLPDPGRFPLSNGFFDFAWVVETHPGIPYSLGVGCAALGCIVRWDRDQRFTILLAACILTAACFFIRVNTFIWLAPTVTLSVAVCWKRSAPRFRTGVVILGAVFLAVFLFLLSWRSLREWPSGYLIRYSEIINDQAPTNYDGLYQVLISHFGRIGAALLGGPSVTFLGTLGLWLPAFSVLGAYALYRRSLSAFDWIPVVLICVALILIVLAPVPIGDDVTEFRHRPTPLLVTVFAVWTVRFAAIALMRNAMPLRRSWAIAAMTGLVGLALLVQYESVGAAKRPRMKWARVAYGTHIPIDLLRVAPQLSKSATQSSRFAVANKPTEGAAEDDASYLTALSGVPAYISYTRFLKSPVNTWRESTRLERLAVLGRLRRASTLDELRTLMRAARITHYVVTGPEDAAFDPKRIGATARVGEFAVYEASSSG